MRSNPMYVGTYICVDAPSMAMDINAARFSDDREQLMQCREIYNL
jgi:hypothetical protein